MKIFPKLRPASCKYLYSLIFNTPFLCNQSEDVDLLLVSGNNAHLDNKEKKTSYFYDIGKILVEIKWKILQ